MVAAPEALRPGVSSAMLKAVFQDIEEAASAGTLDEVEDLHLSRTPMVVDRKGWDDVSALLADTLDRVLEIQAESSARLAGSDEQSMLSKVEILHFKSPAPSETSEETEEAPLSS